MDREIECGVMTGIADCCAPARASGHAAALLNQFPPSDGDWHVPLSVRGLPSNRNNTTPRESSLQGRTFAVNINLPLAADMVEEIERVLKLRPSLTRASILSVRQ